VPSPLIEQVKEQPWLSHDRWKNGDIHSASALTWKLIGGIGLVWSMLAFGIIINILIERGAPFPDPAYLLLLFPAIGLLLLGTAARQYRQWRRFGPLSLSLDPYPGSIGGEVGGSVTVPLRPQRLHDLQATLSCVKVSISGSGKHRSRNEHIVWRQRANTRVEVAANGSKIGFLTPVDAGLPNAETDNSSGHHWILRLYSDNSGLDRSFDIPVFDTGHPAQSRLTHLSIDPLPQTTSEQQFPSGTVTITRNSNQLELHYPASRGSGAGLPVILAGLLFAAIGVFLSAQAFGLFAPHQSTFATIVSGIMGLVFTPAGLALLLTGLYLKLNRLEVVIGPQTVRTQRSAGPFRWRKQVPIAQLRGLDKSIGSQSGQGAQATVYYAIKAQAGEQTLTLGDGIAGQPLADGLLKLIAEQLGNSNT